MQDIIQRIELAGYYDYTHLDAAHIVTSGGKILAYIPEPQARADVPFGQEWDESAWRQAVRTAAVEAGYEGCIVQHDPDRDNAEDEYLS